MDLKTKIRKRLIILENDEEFPYIDDSQNITIGIGYNLTANGLPSEMRVKLCDDHIQFCYEKLCSFPWFECLNEGRQTALIDMVYQMGWSGFLKFREMLGYISEGDFISAGKEMLNSKYGTKYHTRAHKNYDLLISG
jgi:lysozyme